MRGEKEQECLKRAKQIIVYGSAVSAQVLIIDKTDLMKIQRVLAQVVANKESNNFPDFVFERGLVEHFQVSSAKETKKGSEFNKADDDFRKDCQEKHEQAKKDWLVTLISNKMKTDVYEMEQIDCSFENFVKSFKKNFENHLKSLKLYEGSKNISVFLIELVGVGIFMKFNNGVTQLYALSADKEMLLYLQQYKEQVHFIIFVNGSDYEILNLNKIDKLLPRCPENVDFEAGRLHNQQVNLFTDIIV